MDATGQYQGSSNDAAPTAERSILGGPVPDVPLAHAGVDVTMAGPVATVAMAGPHGALDNATKTALRVKLTELADDPAVRAVVLTGSGNAFCVGQDLREHAVALDADATAAWDTLRDDYNPIVLALATMAKPVIAAVNGTAAGAGAAFAFACDLRLMAEGTAFHLAFTSVGLSFDSGLSWTLPRLVGFGRASEMLLRPRPVSASEAVELGLAHEVVPAGELSERVAALAAELAAGPTAAFGAAKQALAYSAAHGLGDSLDMEAGMQTLAGTTEDHAAAVRAFLEKRSPTFNGR
jgi:2-(1,2-epoxy-1,2-dihydrophenyl)acetyl-CoA isomerase